MGEPSPRRTVDSWLKDFFAMVTCMARLDLQVGDYMSEIREHFYMQMLLAAVSELIDNTQQMCLEYRGSFMRHDFLWSESIPKAFEKFLSEDAHDVKIIQHNIICYAVLCYDTI